MNIEKRLERLKADYHKIEPPLSLLGNGWHDLEYKLKEPKKERFSFSHLWNRSLALATIVLLLFAIGLFNFNQAVQASLPGERLHPIKCLCENAISSVTGNSRVKIDHRAEEIIGLVKEKERNQEALDKVVEEYKQVVAETKEKVNKDDGERSELDEELREHHEQFEDLIEKDSSLHEELDEVVGENEH